MVYGQVYRMVRNEQEAKDIVQTTWIKVWNKIDTFKFESAFSTWLYRVATFSALDAIRKRNSKKESSLEDISPSTQHSEGTITPPDQLRSLELKELNTHFRNSLEKLPQQNKEAITLREIDGLSYAEIAKRMNCKPGTVMSRIFNARKSLQQHMKDFLK